MTDANERPRKSKVFPLSGKTFPFCPLIRGGGACRRILAWGIGVLPHHSGSRCGSHPSVGWALGRLANELRLATLLVAEPILRRRERRLLSSDRLATLLLWVMSDEPH